MSAMLAPVAKFHRREPSLWHVAVGLVAILLPSPSHPVQAQSAVKPAQSVHDSAAVGAAADKDDPAELLNRLDDKKLSPEQISTVASRVLRLQADSKTPWDLHWGDFIEKAREQGKLSDDLWYKYLLGAIQFQVEIATETKRADGLAVRCVFLKGRCGTRTPSLTIRGRRESEFSGIKLDPYRGTGYRVIYDKVYGLSGGGGSGGCGFGWTEKLTDAGYASLKPGRQTYHYRYHAELMGDLPDDKVAQAKPLAERVIEGTLPWTLLADKQSFSLPEVKTDPAQRPAVEKCLRAQAVRDTRDTSLVQLMISVDEIPVGMAFDVSLRAEGRERKVGSVAWSKGSLNWWAFDVDLSPGVEEIDLVLTPSAKAAGRLKHRDAYRLVGLDSIWGGEAIVKTVRIQQSRLGGMSLRFPVSDELLREELIEQLAGNDPVVQKLKGDGDVAAARRDLDKIVQKEPKNAVALFNLGCATAAAGDWRRALDCFAKVRQMEPNSELGDKAQRQLRETGSHFVLPARRGDATAMCGLGVMYERGWGPKQDLQEAKKWYRNAANAGNAEAMCHLAGLYEQDRAASQSDPKAEAWYGKQISEMYHKAADLGNEEAKKWVATHDQR